MSLIEHFTGDALAQRGVAGFVISADACALPFNAAHGQEVHREVTAAMLELEIAAHRRFGSGSDPLMISARLHGIHVPGVATSVENIGFNRLTANALRSRYSAKLSDELGTRFYQTYGEVVHQIPSHHLRALNPVQLRDRMLELSGTVPPADPWQQLRQSIDGLVTIARRPRTLTHLRRSGGQAGSEPQTVTVEVVEPVS